jgi:hypothetical protein
MNLALAIVFLWAGAALLFIAFHPLNLKTAKGAPSDVLGSLRVAMEHKGNAYNAA